MKTVLILLLLGNAAVLSGCSSPNQGGTMDTYNSSTSGKNVTGPTTVEPSLPQGFDNNEVVGPRIPPP